ncbi:MAG: hypothetical protein HRF45_02480 [Fimbriimonadia bacterium]
MRFDDVAPDGLRNKAPRNAHMNWYIYDALVGARYAASQYLTMIEGDLPQSEIESIRAAGRHYREEAAHLESARDTVRPTLWKLRWH